VVREKRAGKIDQAVVEALGRGWTVLFVTCTAPHSLGQALADTFDVVRAGRAKTRDGRPWQRVKNLFGCVGSIRAWEVTHGAKGWHPHSHELLFFDRPVGDGEVQQIGWHYQATYGALVEAQTGRALHGEHGIDVRRVTDAGTLGGYLTKVEGGWGAGLELARSDAKKGRGGGRTPWELLGDAAAGDVQAAELWAEYESATAGVHCIQWSAGLKDLLGVVDNQTDEEAAASEADGDVELWSVEVPADQWMQLLWAGGVGPYLDQVEQVAANALGRAAPPPDRS
jgi:hypothetical protein